MTRITKAAPFALPATAVPPPWRRAAIVLRLWSGRRRSRCALAQLDGHLLRDIGLDTASAGAEARRPFWR